MEQGTCAALIDKPQLALEIITATKKGAGRLPVSVKTRLGVKIVKTESWITTLLKAEVAAITIHARTAHDMSKAPARWEEVAKAVKLRDKINRSTLILGNGDVKNLDEASFRISETGADGVMIGRAAFGSPWMFNAKLNKISVNERLKIMTEHAELFEKVFSPPKNFAVMRKHFKAYASGFAGASELRARLMQAPNAAKVKEIVNSL
jgi:tRNA-dihydrouridine synthase